MSMPARVLETGRDRAGAQRRNAHAGFAEFLPQRFAERENVGLGRVIDRHARPRQKPAIDATLRIPPR